MTDSVDTQVLMAEIEAEARRRRVSGEIPSDLEADLDARFNRLVPKGSGKNLGSVLQRVVRDSVFDFAPPTDSARRGGAAAKKGLGKLSSWYIRYVGQQVGAFAASVTTALQLLADRVDALEDRVGVASKSDVARIADTALSKATDESWNTEIAERLRAVSGRVLVARTGTGALIDRLVAQGIDVYGVDARDVPDIPSGLDVRAEDLLVHLAGVAPGVLGGAALIDVPDQITVDSVLGLLRSVHRAMAGNAILVVVAPNPSVWRRSEDGMTSDFRFGAALAPATWERLLLASGFVDVDTVAAEPARLIDDLDVDDPVAAAVNDRLRTLEAAITVPASYLIVARRAE